MAHLDLFKLLLIGQTGILVVFSFLESLLENLFKRFDLLGGILNRKLLELEEESSVEVHAIDSLLHERLQSVDLLAQNVLCLLDFVNDNIFSSFARVGAVDADDIFLSFEDFFEVQKPSVIID